jgi:hypothetical protein
MRALRAVSLALAGCTNGPSMACGTGTMLQGETCVVTPLACGTGTHGSPGSCIAGAPEPYQLRAPAQIIADGTTPATVIAFGVNADGTPATDELVFATERLGAGAFSPTTVVLDARGGVATFVPCTMTDVGCLGPLRLTVARTTAPTIPIAHVDVELVAPPIDAPAAHCLTGGNTFYLEGAGFLYTGALTITDAMFQRSGGTQRGQVQVAPTDPIQGTQWTLTFDSVQLGQPLTPGLYPNSAQVPQVGQPLIDVTGNTPFATCMQSYAGTFQVHDFSYTTSLQHMTVSFREWCLDNPNQVASGCVHVE